MPRLYIENEYSHMGGLELLKVNKPYLYQEILTIFKTTEIPEPIKESREKTMKGKMVWSGPAFNKPLSESFKRLGWDKKRYDLGNNRSIEIDFVKERVGLEIQFGKYSFVDTDFSKFEIFYYQNLIDLCVEIVPSQNLKKKMYSGVPDFIQVLSRIKAKGRNNPAVPIWIIGVNIQE